MTTRDICPPDHSHGLNGTCYVTHKCGCDECREWARDYQFWRGHMHAAGHQLLVDPTGTRRRLQALIALGWSMQELADQLRDGRGNVRRWVAWERPVNRNTAKRIADLFNSLCMTVPPERTPHETATRRRTRALAERNNWQPPLAWDDIDNDPAPATTDPTADIVDDIAVALAVRGERVTLTRDERHIAVTTLNRVRGYDDQVIAKMLGVSDKTIARDREHLGLPAAVGPDRERIAS